ncbi:hypothetical protein B0H63DRAFT_2386 [Podospora didyma]|uniref:Apple domain-containing protein n=1 Tax=Podospora didyma TaxID=330526 RepID=A0AAE0P437_9PEZI|nr:hypothetical protein B0H63DRAFT_2386 [Podospora didyma]
MATQHPPPPPQAYHPDAGHTPQSEYYNDGLIPTDHSYPEVYTSHHTPKPMSAYPASSIPPYPGPGYPPTAYNEKQERPFWKRKATWLVIFVVIVLAVLAGILGAMASGAIKTAGNSSPQTTATATGLGNTNPSSSPSPTSPTGAGTSASSSSSSAGAPTPAPPSSTANPTVATVTNTLDSGLQITVECPAADGLNYTITSQSRGKLTFRRQCGANYPFGDIQGFLPKPNVISMASCLETCGGVKNCVGVMFGDTGDCWLKNSIGVKELAGMTTESGILWQ